MASNYAEEFPLLAAQNLYAADIKGDGNCLFNALSDQLYGHQGEHENLRAKVIEYLRQNGSYFKSFMDVNPGGGQRRNPKRKNAGAYSNQSQSGPTQAEIDRSYEAHLKRMAQGGTYGDNMEIVAFARAFKVDVKVYFRDHASVLAAPEDGTKHPMAHIAYHQWEHYSSIRNLDGPHTGPPNLHPKTPSPEEEAKGKAEAAKVPPVHQWQIDNLASALPFPAGRDLLKRTLEQTNVDLDRAYNVLVLDKDDRASSGSQTGSFSSERDPGSDDEDLDAPNKKQDRRMSRATRAMKKDKAATASLMATNASNLFAEADTASDSTGERRPSMSPRRRLVPKSRLPLKKEQVYGWVSAASDSNEDADRSSVEIIDDSDLSGISRPASVVPENQDGLSLTPKNNIKLIVKPKAADTTSKSVRISASRTAQLKKATQKAARKESKKTTAQTTRDAETVQLQTPVSTPSPPGEIGRGIKTLYI